MRMKGGQTRDGMGRWGGWVLMVLVQALWFATGGTALSANEAPMLLNAPTESTPNMLDTTGSLDAVRYVVMPDGTAYAAWIRVTTGRNSANIGKGSLSVVAATRPVGREWQPPTTLGTVPSIGGATREVGDVEIVATSDGAVQVVWTSNYRTTRNRVVRTATRSRGQWSPAVILSAPARSAGDIALARGPNGVAHLVWTEHDVAAGTHFIRTAMRTSGGNWSSARDLAGPLVNDRWYNPQVKASPNGAVTVVWNEHGDTATESVARVATRSPGGAWAFDSSAVGGEVVGTAVSEDGTAHVAWCEPIATEWKTFFALHVSTRNASGSWSSVKLPGAPLEPCNSELSTATTGAATITWRGENQEGQQVRQDAFRPAGGDWASPALPYSMSGSLVLIADRDGTLHATATTLELGKTVTRVTSRSPGGEWSLPVVIARSPFSLSAPATMLIDGNGAAYTLWCQHDSSVQGKDVCRFARRPANGAWRISGLRLSDYVPIKGSNGRLYLFVQGVVPVDAKVRPVAPLRLASVAREGAVHMRFPRPEPDVRVSGNIRVTAKQAKLLGIRVPPDAKFVTIGRSKPARYPAKEPVMTLTLTRQATSALARTRSRSVAMTVVLMFRRPGFTAAPFEKKIVVRR